MGETAILNKDETYELIFKTKSDDKFIVKSARDMLIEYNLKLVWSVVYRYQKRSNKIEPEDLFQIGTIGLIKAIDKFDPSYNVQFSTYAIPMINGEIQRFLRDVGGDILKISRQIKELNIEMIKFKSEYYKQHNEDPSIEHMAYSLGVTQDKIVEVIMSRAEIQSINEIVYEEDGKPISLLEKIPDNSDAKLHEYIFLEDSISKLPERLQLIINLRYMQDMTQSEVGKILGISQVQASRLEVKALHKLRDSMAGEDFIPKKVIEFKTKEEVNEMAERNLVPRAGKKKLVYEMLDKGWNKERVMREAQISNASFTNYRSMWKKERNTERAIEKISKELPIDGIDKLLNKKENLTVTVDITLPDDTVIKNASIFYFNPQPGQEALKDIAEIDRLFENKKPVRWQDGLIGFQTLHINGFIHAINVLEYKINIQEE